MVVRNLAQQFSPNEMVIAGEKPFEEIGYDWEDTWPEIHYLSKSWPINRRGRDKWRTLQFPLVLARTLRLVLQKKCDVILAIYSNIEFFFAGYLVARLTGARFFPYYHNTLVENRSGLGLLLAKWLQSSVFSTSECVFVISEGLAEYYRSHYPDVEFSVLVHSFTGPVPSLSPRPVSQSPLHLVILGNPTDACLDAIKRVCEAVSRMPDCWLEFYSGTPRSFFESHGLIGDRIQHRTIPQAELFQRLREADILVLPHGFTGSLSEVEYQTIFPTRTIDYFNSGRPILAHSLPDCYLTRFLRQHNCALVVDRPDPSDLVDAITKLRHDQALQNELIGNAIKVSEMFRASLVAEQLRSRILNK